MRRNGRWNIPEAEGRSIRRDTGVKEWGEPSGRQGLGSGPCGQVRFGPGAEGTDATDGF